LEIITPQELRETPLEKTTQRVHAFMSKFGHSYMTVDIDALDPAYAPGVGNPEPDGLTTNELLTLVQGSVGRNTIGLDAVEVSPERDSGQTAAVCAKVIFEAIAALSVRGPQK
jgi:agmatinase